MRKIITAIFAFSIITAVSACTSETPELYSPCVGAKGSPCDKRSPNLNEA